MEITIYKFKKDSKLGLDANSYYEVPDMRVHSKYLINSFIIHFTGPLSSNPMNIQSWFQFAQSHGVCTNVNISQHAEGMTSKKKRIIFNIWFFSLVSYLFPLLSFFIFNISGNSPQYIRDSILPLKPNQSFPAGRRSFSGKNRRKKWILKIWVKILSRSLIKNPLIIDQQTFRFSG